MILAPLSIVCYNDRIRAGGGGLVPMLMFIIFLIAIIFFLLGLGYGLSWIEERSTRRYRTAQEAAVKEEHPEAKV
jgi:Tfp pilus assembly protein PilO